MSLVALDQQNSRWMAITQKDDMLCACRDKAENRRLRHEAASRPTFPFLQCRLQCSPPFQMPCAMLQIDLGNLQPLTPGACCLCRWFGNTLDYDQDAPRQVLCDWISASGTGVAAFDFPTKGILQEAAKYTQYDRLRDRDGRAPGLLGWWPQKACTFIDNHDTG